MEKLSKRNINLEVCWHCPTLSLEKHFSKEDYCQETVLQGNFVPEKIFFFFKEAAIKADRSSCLWMTMKCQVWGITYLDSERFHLKTNFTCTYNLGWLVGSTGWGGREHLEDPHQKQNYWERAEDLRSCRDNACRDKGWSVWKF